MAKGASKRMALRQKYKIKKKVTEHHRQQRRAANKAKSLGVRKSSLKKDPGIPNTYPFKKEVLQEVERRKQEEEEENERKKEARKARRKINMATDFQALRDQAERRQSEYEQKLSLTSGDEPNSAFGAHDNSRKAYFKEFRKVVDESDVILEILDARDPMGCRCPEIEKFIMNRNTDKRIVLVLNKIDLVPKEVVFKWLTYFRTQFPTIAFKSNTQVGAQRLGRANVDYSKASDRQIKSQVCLGADTLLKLLKNYTRNKNIKTGISVGVIGYPNVGKSSLINSLSRKRVVDVAAMPGCTTRKQDIYLDKHIRLLDCPGIVFSSKEMTDTGILLRSNSIKVEQIDDTAAAVDLIVKQSGRERLMELYGIAGFETSREFLGLVANKRGKYKRGGGADFGAAAKIVVLDWNSGKVPFYTVPPESAAAGAPAVESAAIVSQWAQEFDLDALLQDDSDTVMSSAAKEEDAIDGIQCESGAIGSTSGEQMMSIEESEVTIGMGPLRHKRKKNDNDDTMASDSLNLQVNKAAKRNQREMQKESKKMKRREEEQSQNSMQTDDNEAYSFANDFRPAAYAGSSSSAAMVDDDEDEYEDGGEEEEDLDMDSDGDIAIE